LPIWIRYFKEGCVNLLKEFYDLTASSYDFDLLDYEKSGFFPYADYHHLLDSIASYMSSHQHLDQIKVLDLGVGTAELYTKVEPSRLDLDGVDFSRNMLEIARLKVPNGKFYEHDFLCGLPDEIRNEKYDFIVSTFVIQHLEEDQLIEFIHYCLDKLSPFGKIILGDNIFLDEHEKKSAFEKAGDSWRNDLHFHVYNQIVSKIKEHLALSFMKITSSSGIIIIENYHELSLQYEDNLVKYKSNTMKWKSTKSLKKRE